MKKLFIILISLTGCTLNNGFEVSSAQIQTMSYQLKFKCTEKTSNFKQDITIAVCDTLEECNKICELKRSEEK